jgi:hypothetical protein
LRWRASPRFLETQSEVLGRDFIERNVCFAKFGEQSEIGVVHSQYAPFAIADSSVALPA